MKPAKRKPSRKSQTRTCDTLFSKAVRARGYCEASGRTGLRCAGALQAAHIISRRYRSIRWDFDNALSLCQAHHVYWTHRLLEWEDFINKHYPGRWKKLRKEALKPWDKQYPLEELKRAG